MRYRLKEFKFKVSTHSRLKAAGPANETRPYFTCRFNTQPPEGGWKRLFKYVSRQKCFNTQPPEGGWERELVDVSFVMDVSTHSRLKAAGSLLCFAIWLNPVSTHSRLKAAGKAIWPPQNG